MALRSSTSSSFFSIFTYADKYDVLLMILGFVGSVGDGAAIPSMMLIMNGLINVFGNESNNNLSSSASFFSEIKRLSLDFIFLGLAVGIACFFEASSWIKTGERQAARLRSLYLEAILRQDETFFDIQSSSTAEVIESVAADSHRIQEVISEKVPHFLMNVSTFVTSYVVGFILAWRLAVVGLAFLPLLIIPGVLYGRILSGLAAKMDTEHLKAGTVAEQALSAVRTVYSFVGEERTLNKYSAVLESTVKLGVKQGIAKGLAMGSNGVMFAIWAFNTWYGNKLVTEKGVNGGKVIATGIAGIIGGLALGSSLPNIKYFSEAAVAGGRIIEMISRVPEIDHYDENGKISDHVYGQLEFRNVKFAYPTRPDSVIFDGFNLVIPAGKTTALVGSSGSGKSTVIALLQRFYDPQGGEVVMDGVNLKQLKLRWLRGQMGLVNQEPAMFATTVKQNILFGKEDANPDEIIEAAKKSNAHNFISELPDGYETQVGERGVQLSGGQRQMIAIARAMIRNPKILLLDEATSALDAESERVVQEALDMASIGRTTVFVAHRLSTVRHADAVAVVKNGMVSEMGRHDDLMEKPESAYAALVLTSTAVKPVAESTGDDIRKRTSSLARKTLSALSSDSGSFRSLQEDAATKDDDNPQLPSLGRLVGLNMPEWRNAVFGTLGASVNGVIQPLYAFCLGGTVIAFFSTDREHQRRLIKSFSFGFLALAVASFLSNAVQHYNFAAMGEHLTNLVRQRMLANVLTFEIGWFDASESNSSGAVAGRLASDAKHVRSVVGDCWSMLVTTVVAISVACTFGLVLAWQLALVILAVQPIIFLCFYFRQVLIKRMSETTLAMQQQSNQLAVEYVSNHRTVAAFCSQPSMLRILEASQAEPRRTSSRQAIIGGCGLSSAQFLFFCSLALDFWYGGKLVSKGDITAEAMFKTYFILVSTGRFIAECWSMTSDLAKGASAAASIFAILDRKTLIWPDDGQKLEKIEGEVEFRHVEFAYPQRPDVLVFRDFKLRIPTGKSVALVGKSGSGKSTVISLIERFYDPLKGSVLIDGWDIRNLHLRSLRRHISLVGQEPTLFAGTVRENILYGKDDASEDEIVEAAKAANAHDFICALSCGYDTNVGDRGVQVSGGQKQRIAIARAILKNPAILLLDEATSALDTQSEKVVQEALDRIMVHRTTIVVAHRLSTIQNCDSISVIQEGAIVEQGKHGDLMARGDRGVYYNLVKLQHQHLTMT